MSNKILVKAFFVLFLPIVSQSVYANGNVYQNHIYEIGVIENAAGNLLIRYSEMIDNLSVDEHGINEFNKLAVTFREIHEKHNNLNPPSKYNEVHYLLMGILEAHMYGFEKLTLGLEKKDHDYVKIAYKIFDIVNRDMSEVRAILDKEAFPYMPTVAEGTFPFDVTRCGTGR